MLPRENTCNISEFCPRPVDIEGQATAWDGYGPKDLSFLMAKTKKTEIMELACKQLCVRVPTPIPVVQV